MDVLKLAENGPVLISPKIFKDNRGYFYESFNEKEFKEKVGDINFVQDNQSCSAYGVLRGLHFQTGEYEQAKLVRVVKGAVADVAVDIRPDSKNYGKYYFAYLSEENNRQFFIPRGFAHGFVSLREGTILQYKCDNFYNKESEGAIFYADPTLGIPWGQWINWSDIKVSDKDTTNPLLNNGKNEINVDGQ